MQPGQLAVFREGSQAFTPSIESARAFCSNSKTEASHLGGVVQEPDLRDLQRSSEHLRVPSGPFKRVQADAGQPLKIEGCNMTLPITSRSAAVSPASMQRRGRCSLTATTCLVMMAVACSALSWNEDAAL